MMPIEELKKKRFQFLHKFYEVVGGNETRLVVAREIGNMLGFEESVTHNIKTYLVGEGLIELKRANGSYSITHKGVTEVESALSHPDKPTNYFPAINIITNSTITNSQIQQASNGQTQMIIIDEKYNELDNILQVIKYSLDKINISAQQKSELDARIQEIKKEIVSKNPDKTVVSKGVESIKRILEGVASGVIASGLMMMLVKAMSVISN